MPKAERSFDLLREKQCSRPRRRGIWHPSPRLFPSIEEPLRIVKINFKEVPEF